VLARPDPHREQFERTLATAYASRALRYSDVGRPSESAFAEADAVMVRERGDRHARRPEAKLRLRRAGMVPAAVAR